MDQSDFEDIMRAQRRALSAIASESETENTIKLMSIINDLVTDRNKKIHKEMVIIEAQAMGMGEADIERAIATLKKDNMIFEPEPGFIRRVA